MYRRLLIAAFLAMCAWGCKAKEVTVRPGFDAGPTFAGSCNFAKKKTCDEYADADAKATTEAACTGAGGNWTTGQCPLDGRISVCTEPDPKISLATRNYAYSQSTTTDLKGVCPQDRFAMLKQPPGTGGSVAPPPPKDAGEEDSGS